MNEVLAPPPRKWARLTGADREGLRDECAQLYEHDGLSVRELAEHIGRSYGATHRLLVEAGVQMRPRGNPRRA